MRRPSRRERACLSIKRAFVKVVGIVRYLIVLVLTRIVTSKRIDRNPWDFSGFCASKRDSSGVSTSASPVLPMFCLQLSSVLTLFSSLFCLPGVFRARWARRRRCRLSSHPVCPCSAVFLCLLCASRRLLWRWGGPSCCGFRGGLLCVGGLWACVGRPSGRWSCAAGCPPRGLFGSCPGARRCASPVTFGVGLCRALASSVWSLRCAFAVASCSARSGLRFVARCISSVGSVRSVVSLPLMAVELRCGLSVSCPGPAVFPLCGVERCCGSFCVVDWRPLLGFFRAA